MPIQDYSTDPDLNVQISGINIAEGCPPSGINNAIRQLMADVKVESEAKAEAISAAGEALEAFAEGQATRDAAQDEAIAEAQSSAEAVREDVTELDTTLRQLIAEELAKYLPLAGGKMTGNLEVWSLYANQLNSSVTLGVGSTWNDGPSLSLYGPDASGNANQFILRAGKNACALGGNANGDLYWDGKSVITSSATSNTTNDAYVRFSNGIQICWGQAGGSSNPSTHTLPAAFVDTNYKITCNPVGTSASVTMLKITSHKVASFTFIPISGTSVSTISADYIAVGRWK